MMSWWPSGRSFEVFVCYIICTIQRWNLYIRCFVPLHQSMQGLSLENHWKSDLYLLSFFSVQTEGEYLPLITPLQYFCKQSFTKSAILQLSCHISKVIFLNHSSNIAIQHFFPKCLSPNDFPFHLCPISPQQSINSVRAQIQLGWASCAGRRKPKLTMV